MRLFKKDPPAVETVVLWHDGRYCVIPRLFGVNLSKEHREWYDNKDDAADAAIEMREFYELEYRDGLLNVPQIRDIIAPPMCPVWGFA